jgi:predicted DCC family thiol-disulfide oxidoreductase YuxK
MPAHESLTVLYDADCGFCRWTLAALLRWDRDVRLLPVEIQSAEGQALLHDVPPDRRLASAHAVTPEGHVYSGGAAAEHVARLLPAGAPFAAAAHALERPVDRSYRWVADHRTGLSRFVPSGFKDRAAARIERHAARARARVRVP